MDILYGQVQDDISQNIHYVKKQRNETVILYLTPSNNIKGSPHDINVTLERLYIKISPSPL